MLKLLLVGDKPSSKNTDPNVAFVGTASYKRLECWLEELLDGPARVLMINRVDVDFKSHLIMATLNHYKIIALGEEATIALIDHGVVQFFRLPHPSGRNRKLNNKAYVAEKLMACRHWLREG